jgi:hypothetical protein
MGQSNDKEDYSDSDSEEGPDFNDPEVIREMKKLNKLLKQQKKEEQKQQQKKN